MVELIDWEFVVNFSRPRSLSQGSPGVPGTPEAGDRFGAAVAPGPGTPTCDQVGRVSSYLAIGVPGEDLGGRRDAGAVNLQQQVNATAVNATAGCQFKSVNLLLAQGAGTRLGGAAEAGDRVGAALSG